MKKNLLKGILAGLFLTLGAAGVSAQEYIDAKMAISDGTTALYNNATIGGLGNIDIYWQNTELAMANTNIAQKNFIDDFQDKFSITVAGQEMVTADNFPNNGTKAGFYLTTLYETNEQFGGTDEIKTTVLRIQLPDAAYFNWKGQWVLTIQPGTVETTDGKINPEIKIVFYSMSLYGDTNLTYPAEWSPTPSGQDNTISAPQAWGTFKPTLTWSGVTSLALNENAANEPFIQKQTDGVNGDKIPILNLMSIDGTNIEFDFTGLTGGTYSLELPEATVFINNDYMSWSTQLNFTIENAPEPVLPMVSYTPSNTSTIESLNEVTVTWMYAELTQGTGNVTVTRDDVVLETQPTVRLENVNASAGGSGEDNTLVIDFSGIELESGEYTITIDKGYVNVAVDDVTGQIETLPNEEVVITYKVEVPDPLVLDDPEVNPVEGEVESLATVTFTWPAARIFELNSKVTEPVTVTYNDTDYTEFEVSVSGNALTVTFNEEVTEAGTYTISIPASYLIGFDSMEEKITNDEVEVTYTIVADDNNEGKEPDEDEPTDGIAGIKADADGMFTVYNLQGQSIMRTGSNSDLIKLGKGFFIINGKKVNLK